jgi:hypothetical protein
MLSPPDGNSASVCGPSDGIFSGASANAEAQLQQAALAAAMASVTPADSSSSNSQAASTSTVHDQVLGTFASPNMAPAFGQHAANSSTSGDAGSYRNASLRDLLLGQTSGATSHDTTNTTKRTDLTCVACDTDATDECFATLGGGPSANLL